ncbi:MAG: Lrp/AsnC family transcriptional regulator [Prevotella sp.]|nr:Lrp/AsnC family transcriptional regulator [Prevotella sp.]MDO4934757.1 Lrp/AsnC family transcriptional regulator [Prevotella sp.]
MNETESLDRTDLLILDALQHNARMTNKELAAQVHLSPTPVFERWKRLEREGYIKKYIAVLDADKLNRGFVVFCSVKLSRLNTETANDFTTRVMAMPEVTECYNISGHFDYMLKLHSFDMKQYQRFLIDVLGKIESVASIESTFVMEEVKHEYGVGVVG